VAAVTARSVTYGLVIEGLGIDLSYADGLCLSYGDPPDASLTTYDWRTLATSVPGAIDNRVSIFTGELSTSDQTWEVAGTDLVRGLLLYTPGRTRNGLTVDITATTTTVQVAGPGNTGLANTVIWVRDEAILLGTHTSAGEYTGCQRAWWSTRNTAHRAGDLVYRRQPYWTGRQATVIEHDRGTATERVVFRGFLADDPSTSEDGTRIQIRIVSALSAISQGSINRESPLIQIEGSVTITRARDARPVLLGSAQHTPRVARAGDATLTFVQAGSALVTADVSADRTRLFFLRPAITDLGGPNFEYEEGEGGAIRTIRWEDGAREVFVVRGDPADSSSRELGTLHRHPIALAYAFLRSGSGDGSLWDAWGGAWGLGAPAAWFDEAAIEAAIVSTGGLQIDQLILGWDGRDVRVVELAVDLLRSYGFYWALTEDGLISIGRVEDLGIAEYAELLANPRPEPVYPRLSWRTDPDSVYREAIARIGDTPWDDPAEIVQQSRDGRGEDSIRIATQRPVRRLRYDLPWISRATPPADVEALLLTRLLRGYYGTPIVGVRVPPAAVPYDLGARILLDTIDVQSAWWIDPETGQLTDISDPTAPELAGLIVRSRLDLSTGLYDLDLVLTQYRSQQVARWRAPSAEVVAWSAPDLEVAGIGCEASDFAIGDRLALWTQDGTLRDSGAVVAGITGDELELSPAFAVTPTAGNIVRYERIDLAVYGEQIAGFTGRVWAYLADEATGELSDGQRGDIYA
jgi:hypothetical protein